MLDFIKNITKKGISISLAEDKLSVKYNESLLSSEELSSILEEVRANKQALLAYLKEHDKQHDFEGIKKVEESSSYSLSSAQKRLWILSQIDEGNIAYNMPAVYKFKGALNRTIFEKSIRLLADRHEVLRTVFRLNDQDEIRQIIQSSESYKIHMNFSMADGDEDVRKKIETEINRPFDLKNGPLFRTHLIQISEKNYVFIYVIHHIISDGWSMNLLINETLSLYEEFNKGKEYQLPQLKIQYKDYASWQQLQLTSNKFDSHKAYWLENLSGNLPIIELLTDKIRPAVKTYNGAVLTKSINKRDTEKLKLLSQQEGTTLFMGLIAIINTLFHRYTGQEDLILGTPVSGREHADLINQVGFYVNTLVIRTKFDKTKSFRQLLQKVKSVVLKGYDHQVYPFDQIVDDLGLERDLSRNALFDIMVVLHNTNIKSSQSEPQLERLKIEKYQASEQKTSKFDLTFDFIEGEEGLGLSIDYNTDIFSSEFVHRLATHLEGIFTAVLNEPEKPINSVDFLSVKEKEIVLAHSNGSRVDYRENKTIVDLFESQVECTPNNVALVFDNVTLTYQDLNVHSNKLAHYLVQKYDIQPDDLVAVIQERSDWMMVSILAILKAGGAYVPIDPRYPADRTNYIKKDTGAKVVLDLDELEKFNSQADKYPNSSLKSKSGVSNLAYAIYTSGSTGKPKGVLLEHKGLVNRLNWMTSDLKITNSDVFLQKTPTTFDVSVWELFLPLINGAKLVIAKPDKHKDPIYIKEILVEQQVSIVHFVPSMLNIWLDSLSESEQNNLRHVVCSGEALTEKLVERFLEKMPIVKLHNYYGPTEATIDVTAIDLSAQKAINSYISIGKPIDNTSIYIVNESLVLQGIDVPGEILIGGVQVARGYLNKEVLTQEKFIESPFKQGERLYRTGDIGRWKIDGNIQFIGRVDDQVKIRGNRIELDEIVHCLESITEVFQAVVITTNFENEIELVAYLIATEELNVTDLRSQLNKRLPDYMIPAFFVQLDEFPLTTSGKIDRKNLPNPDQSQLIIGTDYEAPRNEMETKLVNLASGLLPKTNINLGINDNFFDLGMNSLRLVKFSNLINKEFGLELRVMTLFEYPSIKTLSEYLATGEQKNSEDSVDHNDGNVEALDEMINLMDDFE